MEVELYNKELAEQRGLSEEQMWLLDEYYMFLDNLLLYPWAYTNTGQEAVEMVQEVEADLQSIWGFDINPNMWHYEFVLKGCKCPLLDNREKIGTPYRIYNTKCPFHGKNREQPIKEK